ncbi:MULTISPECIES: glycosyltransferase family 2 protein [Arthrobacter]|uniref:Glycosyltransferase involved in cell wall biosynthesis n=1 Tax=Arthrobacter bambusae TaxID=1338426 RepID=A0AAW8DJM8_9MICC|nr:MULTISPECIES: glycosyltransferase family 2 protein [Arthrobacter]MDP9905088.1 glycosyltransferase involved in cell wall biosynthesis [Arthrobacter bambusae]MDQ0129904.1 glycosyltransferase involved in cell wall biosynthesis [Arthrobacter bambusae]MDQ0181284.1 glycosyltransferase involved in cell wall biosynthesis [Arthrobacter bambusae]
MENHDSTRVLVIMPAWNEAESVGDTVREVLDVGCPYDVLVVNDGSSDATAEVAAEAGATVLNLPFNLGVGGAMRAGFKYAKRLGYSRVIQVDADGQHDPRNIGEVLAGLEHADISIGARFADKGEYKVSGPRKWAMQFLAKVISGLAKTRLTDVTSGFRAANDRAISQYLDHYPAEYLGDTIDSLVVAIRSGCKVTQIPVAMRPRQGGTPSHNPAKAAVYLGRSTFALLFALTRKRSAIPSASTTWAQEAS